MKKAVVGEQVVNSVASIEPFYRTKGAPIFRDPYELQRLMGYVVEDEHACMRAAVQPGSKAARQPGSQAARQPGSQAARQPGMQEGGRWAAGWVGEASEATARRPGGEAAGCILHYCI